MVSGIVDTVDANHPKEVYYGRSGLFLLSDMTSDLSIRIYPEDKTEIFPAPNLGLGSKITINRALPVTINDAGSITIVRTWEKQIKDFLSEQKIILGDQDKVDPDINTWLRSDTRINITRVAETEIKEEESIAYKTITKEDPSMEKGRSKVESAGKNGVKIKTFLVRRENGQEVSRKLVGEEIKTPPENKIVTVGTRVVELGRGRASWYDWISGMTAAHNSLPMGSYVRVTAVNSGRSIVVKIIDRGIQTDAIIDLSADAFEQLAPLGAGVIPVVLTKE